MQYIFLSHDVDWRKQGPLHEHLLARKDRFEPEIFQNTNLEKLYYNFPEFMEIEEKLDVRSTFFFRTKYENGNYLDYEDEIKLLVNGGWEIRVCTDPPSVSEINKLKNEKNIIPLFDKTLNLSRKLNSEFNVMTILWHDNVLKMKGGRIYPKILEFLVSQDDVVMLKGVDIASLLNQHTN